MTGSRRTSGVLVLAVVAAVAVSLLRGVWLDEGYTLWFTGRDLPFAQAFEARWMRDAHPPLYYAWCWLLRPLAGDSIPALRLVNLGFLLPPALTWWAARKVPAMDARFHRLFAMLVCSSPFFILYAAELRSYFAMYVLAATLIAQLRLLLDAGERAPGRLIVVTIATALLLFNIHYLGGLVAGVLLALFALDRLLRRRWSGVVWPVATGVAGVVSVGATAAYYLARAVPGTGHDVGMVSAAVAIGGILVLTLAAAPMALLVALRGAVPPSAVLRDRFATGMAVATALLVLGFLGYNVAQRNLLARYVIGAVPVLLALVAALAAYACARWRWGERAITAGALLAILMSSAYAVWNRRWETNAPMIARLKAECSTTRVYALSAIPFMQASSPVLGIPGVYDAFRLTYRSAAERHGFAAEVIDEPGTRRVMDARCPTILWVEHRFFAPMFDDRALIAAAGLVSPSGAITVRQRSEAKGRLLLVLVPAGQRPPK